MLVFNSPVANIVWYLPQAIKRTFSCFIALKTKLIFYDYVKRKKIRYFLLLLFIALVTLYVIVTRHNKNKHDQIIDEIHGKQLKAVQLLTEKFIYKNWGLGDELGEKVFERCEEKRCYAFKHSKFLQTPLERSDGIMVHAQNLFYLPSRTSYSRRRRQLWLFNTMEPQTFSFCSSYYRINDLDDWFNITTTFKPQSTLLTDYKNFQDWSNIHEHLAYYGVFEEMLAKDGDFWSKKTIGVKRLFINFWDNQDFLLRLVENLSNLTKIKCLTDCFMAKDPSFYGI